MYLHTRSQIFLMFVLGWTLSVAAFAQTKSSVVFHIDSTYSATPPVKIEQILVDGKPITPGTPVSLEGFWLSEVTVLVRNVSQKQIITSDLTLLFPETGDGSAKTPVATTVSNLGRWPEWAFRQKDGSFKPLPEARQHLPEIRVAPGGLLKFEFSAYGDATQADLTRKFGPIHTVNLHPPTSYFDDGSKWIGGQFVIYSNAAPYSKSVTAEKFAAHQSMTAEVH